MANTVGTFKISGLPNISDKEIDKDDLFLITDVSDIKNGKNFASKNISVSQIMNTVASDISKGGAVSKQVNNAVDNKISKATSKDGTIDKAITTQISTQSENTGIIGKAITNNISAEAGEKGILAPIIKQNVETQISAVLSSLDMGGAFD